MVPSPSLYEGRLSEAQIKAYWKDGYLFPLPVLPAQEAAALRAELEQMEPHW